MVFHLEDAGVFDHFEDLELSVFVSFILEYFFDCDSLAGSFDVALVDHAEGAFAGGAVDLVFEHADGWGFGVGCGCHDFVVIGGIVDLGSQITISVEVFVGMEFEGCFSGYIFAFLAGFLF